MRYSIKVTFLLLVMSAIALLAGCAQAPSTAALNKTSTSANSATPSYMYVISARQGYVKSMSPHHYEMRIRKVDLGQIVQFSDRPARIVRYITGFQMQNLWRPGYDSFFTDPPNAVLSSRKLAPVIVQIRRQKVNQHEMLFLLYCTKSLPIGMLRSPVLTIDSGCSAADPNNC